MQKKICHPLLISIRCRKEGILFFNASFFRARNGDEDYNERILNEEMAVIGMGFAVFR